MQIFHNVSSLKKYLQSNTKSIAVIPTMGGLHRGHLSLIDMGKKYAKLSIVSIFVNKKQFGVNEDFDIYPRTPSSDIELLTKRGVDVLFMPSHEEIYPSEYSFNYNLGSLATVLCGSSRPHHFFGVAKVVYRFLDIIKPTYAVFGQKDYQQFIIIKQMIQHFDLDTTMLSGPTQRDEFGLALSTRNNYLNTKELAIARTLYATISRISEYEDIYSGVEQIISTLSQSFDLDYCEVLNADNLGKITADTKNYILVVAVYIGSVRLIDNIIFSK